MLDGPAATGFYATQFQGPLKGTFHALFHGLLPGNIMHVRWGA
jgi:hypothetical protein